MSGYVWGVDVAVSRLAVAFAPVDGGPTTWTTRTSTGPRPAKEQACWTRTSPSCSRITRR